MKLKLFRYTGRGWLIAGALGVFLLLAGQSLGAEDTIPAPDREASRFPAPDQNTLSPPGDNSFAPPDGNSAARPDDSPRAGRQATVQNETRERPRRSGPPARTPEAENPPERAAAGGDQGRAGEQTAGQGGEAPPSITQPASTPRRGWPWSLPQTGPYMGVMAGLNFPSYNTNDTIWTGSLGGSSVDGNLGWVFGLLLGWDFGLLTGEVEALVSFDKAEIDTFSSYSIYNNIAYMEGMSIHIPLLVKMDFHLGPVVLQPLAGPYFNFALGKLNISGSLEGETSYKNPLVGLTAGGVVGLNLGRGFIFVDGRFEIDLGKTKVESIEIWRRSAFVVNLGYQIYLGRKQ